MKNLNIKTNKTRNALNLSRKKFGVAIAVSVLVTCLLTTLTVIAATPTTTFSIFGGNYPGAPDYTIFTDGTNIFAKDSLGVIEYSGTDASTVINQALANSGHILIIGDYEIATPGLQLYNDTFLEVSGTLTMTAATNTAIFQASAKKNIFLNLQGCYVDGQGATQSSWGQGVIFSNVTNFKVLGGTFFECKDTGLTFHECTNGLVQGCTVYCENQASTGGIGLAYGCYYVVIDSCFVFDSETIGINISGGGGLGQYNKIINCHVDVRSSSTSIGISVDGESYYCIVSDNTVLAEPNADAINLEGWGAAVNKSPYGCIISNNRVFYSRIADAGVSTTYPCICNQIIGNFVKDSSQGVYVANANNTLVLGNTFWNCSTTIAYYQSYNYTVASNVEYG